MNNANSEQSIRVDGTGGSGNSPLEGRRGGNANTPQLMGLGHSNEEGESYIDNESDHDSGARYGHGDTPQGGKGKGPASTSGGSFKSSRNAQIHTRKTRNYLRLVNVITSDAHRENFLLSNVQPSRRTIDAGAVGANNDIW